MDSISKRLGAHYDETFRLHGANSFGVDWGADQDRLLLRYDRMLDVARSEQGPGWSLLDVGCGFGGLLEYAQSRDMNFVYSGVDVSKSMIEWAGKRFINAKFDCVDILSRPGEEEFDYVVCNGILTQKLDTPGLEMDVYANMLIRKLFALSRKGVAFNIMTTKVNYFSNKLYYRNPVELLGWCLSELTSHVRLDHAYPLFEYTMYLYKEPL